MFNRAIAGHEDTKIKYMVWASDYVHARFEVDVRVEFGLCSAETYEAPVKDWGLEYLHRYYPKPVVKVTNGLDCEVGYGLLDISPWYLDIPDDDDDDVCNLCLALI